MAMHPTGEIYLDRSVISSKAASLHRCRLFGIPPLSSANYHHAPNRRIRESWSEIEVENNSHPVVYAEKGGHASFPRGQRNGIRQEAWGRENGASVTWHDGRVLTAGTLLNIGEKTAPLNEQYFIQYSGLWGKPSDFPVPEMPVYYWSSGYWGPAYNETEMNEGSGFIKAWGDGAANIEKALGNVREFYCTIPQSR